MGQAASVQKPFLTDVTTLRERARKNLNDGAIGSNYVGDVSKTIEILQSVLATELVCVLRYTMHSIAASGISSEGPCSGLKSNGSVSRGSGRVMPRSDRASGGAMFHGLGSASPGSNLRSTACNSASSV